MILNIELRNLKWLINMSNLVFFIELTEDSQDSNTINYSYVKPSLTYTIYKM